MKKLIRVLLTPPDDDVVFVEDASALNGIVVLFNDGTSRHIVRRDARFDVLDFEGICLYTMSSIKDIVAHCGSDSAVYQLNGLEKPKRIVLEKQDVGEWVLYDNVSQGQKFIVYKEGEVSHICNKNFAQLEIIEDHEVYLITE